MLYWYEGYLIILMIHFLVYYKVYVKILYNMFGNKKMNQFIHALIAIILFNITWHGILKQHPLMQEELRRWEGYCFKKWFCE